MSLVSRRTFLSAAALAPLVMVPGIANATCVGTGCTVGTRRKGSVGVVPNDFLRVSIWNEAFAQVSPGEPQIAPYSIVVLDGDGSVLQGIEGRLSPGRGRVVQLDPARGLEVGQRVHVQIVVRGSKGLPIVGTVETIEKRSGRTRFVDSVSSDPTLLQSLDHASVGVTAGQRLRLALFDGRSTGGRGGDAYRVDISSLDGRILTSLRGLTSPGRSTFVEWGEGSEGFPALALRERLQVHVTALLPSGAESIATSLELLDATTLATQTVAQASLLQAIELR